MPDITPAPVGEQPPRPFYRRRLFWLAGSLLVAAAPVLLQHWLAGPLPPEGPRPANGVHVRAVGLLWASNTVTVDDGAGLPQGGPVVIESRGVTADNVVSIKKKP